MTLPILSQIASEFNAWAAANGCAALCDSSLMFERVDLNAIAAVWRRQAGERSMPARLEITPRELKNCLSHVIFYERLQEGGRRRYRVRLQGSAYLPITGDLTGKFVDEAIPPAQAALWEHTLDTVIAEGGPLRILSRSAALGKNVLVGEFFAAPLADTNGAPNCVMTVGYYDGTRWEEVAARFYAATQPAAISA